MQLGVPDQVMLKTSNTFKYPPHAGAIGELQRSAFISCQDPAQVQIKKLRPSLCSAHTSLCSPSSCSKMAQFASANWTAVWTRACQRVKVTESFVDAISLQPLPCLHFSACEPCFHLQDMFPLTPHICRAYCGLHWQKLRCCFISHPM